MAAVRFGKPALIRISSGGLRRILKEDKPSGSDALDSYGIYDGSDIYRT